MFGALAGCFVDGRCVKQVMQVFTVQLEELNFDFKLTKLGLQSAVLQLLKNKVEYSGHDSNLLRAQAD